MPSGHWEKKGTLFCLLSVKGNPYQKKMKKGSSSSSIQGDDLQLKQKGHHWATKVSFKGIPRKDAQITEPSKLGGGLGGGGRELSSDNMLSRHAWAPSSSPPSQATPMSMNFLQ